MSVSFVEKRDRPTSPHVVLYKIILIVCAESTDTGSGGFDIINRPLSATLDDDSLSSNFEADNYHIVDVH